MLEIRLYFQIYSCKKGEKSTKAWYREVVNNCIENPKKCLYREVQKRLCQEVQNVDIVTPTKMS